MTGAATMPPASSGPGWRLEALTGIRGLAAWYVVFYHIRLSLVGLLPAPLIAALAKGYLAVDLFFMLSGFVLWLNYAPRLARPDAAGLATFWWRRIARIWPLHAVVLAGFVALASAFALTGRDTTGYPPGELPLHLLLIQNWGFTRELAWNHPAWSISTEMAAYLLFPLLAMTAAGRRAGPARSLPLVLAIALLLGALHGAYAGAGHRSLGAAITTFGLLRCLIEFAIGTLAARLWLLWRDHPRRGRAAAAAAAGALAAVAVGAGLRLAETAWVPLALLLVLLFLGLSEGRAVRWLGAGPVHWLGEVSYSTYLCHYGLFIVFKLLFVDASLQLDALRLGGFVVLLLLASGVLYRGIELPAQRALNALRPGRRPSADPARTGA